MIDIKDMPDEVAWVWGIQWAGLPVALDTLDCQKGINNIRTDTIYNKTLKP